MEELVKLKKLWIKRLLLYNEKKLKKLGLNAMLGSWSRSGQHKRILS